MEKSADAFRTISEVADDLSLPQHVLRFWETRFPQIRPLKRAGGRRYYRPADVVLLRSIRQLLYDDGYTIKGVQRLLKEQGARGLGAAPRVAEPGRDPMPDAPDLDDEPIDEDIIGESALPAADAIMSGSTRDLVEDALATMEECRRILDAALRPPR